MSRLRRTRRRKPRLKVPSTSRLALTLRSAPSWTLWRLKRVEAKRVKEERRLLLMEAQVQGQHLLLRELERRQELLARKVSGQLELQEQATHPMLEYQLPEEPMPDSVAEISLLLGLPPRQT